MLTDKHLMDAHLHGHDETLTSYPGWLKLYDLRIRALQIIQKRSSGLLAIFFVKDDFDPLWGFGDGIAQAFQ